MAYIGQNLILPATTATAGQIIIDGFPFLTAYDFSAGDNNIFVGKQAGNFTGTGSDNAIFGPRAGIALTSGEQNTGVGAVTLGSCTTGSGNCAMGLFSLFSLTAGNNNVAIGAIDGGDGALFSLVSGSNNVAIGHSAGNSYVAAESNNILISNSGTISESNVMRLGTTGSGTGQVNSTFIAGTVTCDTGIVSTTGNITASAGDLVASTAAKGVVLGGGAKVVCGTGDPNTVVTAPKGSLYLRLDGSTLATRAYINTNSATAWTNVVTAA